MRHEAVAVDGALEWRRLGDEEGVAPAQAEGGREARVDAGRVRRVGARGVGGGGEEEFFGRGGEAGVEVVVGHCW